MDAADLRTLNIYFLSF